MESSSKQSRLEEIFNTISHGLTMLTTIGGSIVIIILGVRSDKEWSLFSALVYGISLVALYSFSTIYHGLTHPKAKHVFNIMDHIGIFLLIAGTYTPVVILSIGGVTGWTFFGVQWSLALAGIILKVFYTGRYNYLSTLLYAVMGWLIIFKLDILKDSLPEPAYWLLFSGGMAYTAGIVFYIIDYRMKLAHFIWHLFVMAGSLLHYLMMILYIF